MMKLRPAALAALVPFSLLATTLAAAPAHGDDAVVGATPPAYTQEIKVATYNASLNRSALGELREHLSTPNNAQAANIAEVIQRNNPDILLVNEFDYDAEGASANLFRKNYLEVGHNGAEPVTYPYMWFGPVNTGQPSGFDLDHSGTVEGGNDAWGFGNFPGQYGFVVYSKFPINTQAVRTFQNFKWKDMPNALLPQLNGTPWYSNEILEKFPLSSKTHADIPVDVNGTTVHVLAAHPTPPSYDGEEKRNKARNNDEIRLWADYVQNKADYLYDDAGVRGGLPTDANFVILGDYNSDPLDGDSHPGAIDQLLKNPRILDTLPTSEGGPAEALLQGGANAAHQSDPRYDTGDFNDAGRPGNLRIDYVLPNAGTQRVDAHVFWPTREDPMFRLTGLHPFTTSTDHHMVWATLRFPAAAQPEPAPQPTAPGTTPAPGNTPEPAVTTAPGAGSDAAAATGSKAAVKKTHGKLAHTGSSNAAALAGAALAMTIGGGILLALRRRAS